MSLKIMGPLLWFFSMLIAAVWQYEYGNEKVILKCGWFKQILKKKIAFTISVHSHVHPSSKQESMQTKQFLNVRRAQTFS